MSEHRFVRHEVESMPGRHQAHAQGEVAFPVQFMISTGQISRSAGFHVARDAVGVVDGKRNADQLFEGLGGRIARAVACHPAGDVHHIAHQQHRVAVKDAVGFAGGRVMHDLAFFRIRRILRDPGQRQRHRIRHAAAEYAVEHDGMIRSRLVQFLFRKAAVFFKLGFDIAAARDPLALRRCCRLLRQFFLQHVETVDAEQHDALEGLTGLPEMAMAVVDPGHGAAAFQIDEFRPGCGQP